MIHVTQGTWALELGCPGLKPHRGSFPDVWCLGNSFLISVTEQPGVHIRPVAVFIREHSLPLHPWRVWKFIFNFVLYFLFSRDLWTNTLSIKGFIIIISLSSFNRYQEFVFPNASSLNPFAVAFEAHGFLLRKEKEDPISESYASPLSNWYF